MLARLVKWISMIKSWIPYFRNKKRKAEEAEERRRLKRERLLPLKGCILRFKPESSDKYVSCAESSHWFAVKTEEGRKEYF